MNTYQRKPELNLCVRRQQAKIEDNFANVALSFPYPDVNESLYSYIYTRFKQLNENQNILIFINSSELDKQITDLQQLNCDIYSSYFHVYIFCNEESQNFFLQMINHNFDELTAFCILLDVDQIPQRIAFALETDFKSIEELFKNFNKFNRIYIFKNMPELSPMQFVTYLSANCPNCPQQKKIKDICSSFIFQYDKPFKYIFKQYEYFYLRFTPNEQNEVQRLITELFPDKSISITINYDINDPCNNEENLSKIELVVNCYHAADHDFNAARRALEILASN